MKTIFLLCLVVLSSTIVFSQSIHFGIDPGVAISRAGYEPSIGTDRRVFSSFDGGVLIEIGVAPKFMIQPEGNFSIIGVELNDGTNEYTIKHSYVNIPLLAKVNVANRFNLMAGPQVGFLLASRSDPSSGEAATEIKDQFKSKDYGLTVGGEYKFSRHVFLGARYF
jgi:hypothetical protein